MKHLSCAFVAIAAVLAVCDAHADASGVYANAISSHNVAAVQYSVSNYAMNAFSGGAASALRMGRPAAFSPSKYGSEAVSNPAEMYGRAPVYGTMPTYGEYNDDGTIARGRGGGDAPVMDNFWIGWQHYGDDAKFHGIDRLDSDYDLIMLGMSVGHATWLGAMADFGMFAGYVGGDQDNDTLKIDEHGGYFGLYGGYKLGGFGFASTLVGGALYNEISGDDYTNMWVGAAANVTYDIALDDTFTIQPGIYGGYTWIKSGDYTFAGTSVKNDNFNMFHVAPGIRAIKHIASGWYGTIGGKYVFTFANSGDVTVAGAKVADLDADDYTEYGIGLEKAIERFNIAVNVGRRDGGRAGWNGGINIKYIF